MKKIILFVALIFSMSINAESQSFPKVEMPGSSVIPIKDTHSNRQYELLVQLPEDYEDNPDKSYPVIYFSDAVWNFAQVSASTKFILEESILVGLSWQKDMDQALVDEVGEYVSRFRDYSVWPSSNPDNQKKYQFGQAGAHLEFVRKDVIPYVEKHFRIDKDSRTYFGYSLGGLFGAYTLLSQPDTFDNYILGSPSMWRVEELQAKLNPEIDSLNANVFISNGHLENELAIHVNSFIHWLNEREDNTLKLHYEVPLGDHSTAATMTALRGVIWLADLIKE